MNYVLITPILDESNNLLQLRDTILNQQLRPSLWVIVDSGSSDDSHNRAREIFRGLDWIHVIQQKVFPERGYHHKNFAQAINEGYEHARGLANKRNIDYSFVAKTDATPALASTYFQYLLEEICEDDMIAVICGSQHVSLRKRTAELKPISGLAITGLNDIRLYRRDFFENVGGYPLVPSPDVVIAVKAIKGGYGVRVSKRTYFTKHRLGGTKIGSWKGYKLKGEAMYTLNYHPLLVILNAAYTSVYFPPHYQGLALAFGYFECLVSGRERIEDSEISEFFGSKRLMEIFRAIWMKGRRSGPN